MRLDIRREDILAIYEAGSEAVIAFIDRLHTEQQNAIEQQVARIRELEGQVRTLGQQLNKNSHNSSKPHSIDNFACNKPTPKSRHIKSGKNAGCHTICCEKLEELEAGTKNFLKQSHLINFDGMGIRVTGKRNWLHVASTDEITYYSAYLKRGCEAMDNIDILPV